MIENKVREQVLSKQDATHQIKIKKLPKKAKNKYYAFNCFLYVGKRKANHSDVKWYIVDKTDGVYTNISETGLLVLDVDGLREKNGSVTVVAKYKEKQYYHILNRWKDKKKNKALSLGFGLGLGLGLGIPALAGAITGTIIAFTKPKALNVDTGKVEIKEWKTLENFISQPQFKKPDTWAGIVVDGTKAYDNSNKAALRADSAISISKFMNDELNAGIITEGIVKDKFNLNQINNTKDSFNLTNATIEWNTEGDKITSNFSYELSGKTSNNNFKESVSYSFEKDGDNKFAKVTKTDNSTGESVKSVCSNIDYMSTKYDSSTQLTKSLSAKKKGWEILYRDDEEALNNTVINIPYEDFGDKLTVDPDGCASGLEVNPSKDSINVAIDKSTTISLLPEITISGKTLSEITDVSFYYTTVGIIQASSELSDDSKTAIVSIDGKNVGTTSMTIKVTAKDDSNLYYAATATISVGVTKQVEENKIKLTTDAGGETLILQDNIDPNDFIPTDGTNISVHLKDSEETRSISKNDIETVEILTCDPTITTIGNKFLWGYSNLDTFDLSGLTKIKTIGELFLGECYEISSLNWSGLENLEEVGDNFLTQSGTRLTSLDFTGLSSLKKVGEHFADYIQDITSVNLSGLTNLEIIGNNFLFWDGKITSIDLSTLTKLESIGTNFLNMCTGLQTIKLPVVDNIPTLGSWGLGIGRDALTDYISIDCNNEELSATYSTADNWKATSGHFGKTVKWLPQPPAPVYNNSATIAGETFELVDNYTTDMLNWLCPVEGTNSSTINKIFKKDGSEQGEEFNIEELENINICLCDTPTADINEDFLSGAINMVEADISGLSVYDGSDGHKISKNAFKNSYKLEKLNIGSMSTDAFAGVATDYDFACYNWNGQAVPPSNMNKGIEVIGDNALALVNKYEYLFDATAPGKYRHLVTENDCIVLEENSNNVTKEIEVEDKTDLDKLVSEYGGPMNFRYKGDTSYTSVVVKNIRSVSIKKEVDATATCNDFLGGILYSSSLDLSGLTKIKTIGSDFIRGYGLYANALQSIDFNPLANVTDIGDGFLGDCTTLKQLNFNPMKNLETIGTNFLYNCTNLVEVDMSELTSLTNIGDGFIRSSNIQSLYVPLKDPSTITVSSTLFMNWTNAECAIHAGSFADEYKLTTPWDGRSAKIDDQTK